MCASAVSWRCKPSILAVHSCKLIHRPQDMGSSERVQPPICVCSHRTRRACQMGTASAHSARVLHTATATRLAASFSNTTEPLQQVCRSISLYHSHVENTDVSHTMLLLTSSMYHKEIASVV